MKVSVVIPTRNGEATLGRCLEAVFAQQAPFPFDVLVVDSDSTDRTREVAARFPVRIRVIDVRDFDHGDTRNLGALLTDGDLIAFLVQDAWPASRDWLRALAACFDDPTVAGAYCRVLPRPEASVLARRAAERDLAFRALRRVVRIDDRARYDAMSPHERRLFVDFNDVASCLRRSAWRALPFARTAFGEDLLWARGALEAGHAIAFEPAAAIHHSHEYDAAGVRARARVDAWFNRVYLDRVNVANRRDALTLAVRHTRDDLAALAATGHGALRRAAAAPGLLRYHWNGFDGFREGGRSRERRPTPRPAPAAALRVLIVAHSFPPEAIAGTEVFSAALAGALSERGHDVSILHRTADPALADRTLDETRQAGLRVFRFANHLRLRHVGEGYAVPEAEAAFRDVLARVRPDVVHFQHLIHLSARLPQIAREHGVPSLVTLADYWFRCPKVQLLRDLRTPCAGPPPGALACAACVSARPGLVPALQALAPVTRSALAAWAAPYLGRRAGGARTDLVAHLALRPAVMRAGLGAASFLIAPSRFLRDRVVEAGLDPERLVVSDYGFARDWAAGVAPLPRRSATSPLRVGFVGSLIEHKGLEVLAAACAAVADPRVELHVHGDHERTPEAKGIVARVRALAPSVRLHGAFAPGQIAAVLGDLDVLVVPSLWYENSPLTIHEAFLARRPVVVSDLGGMRELVADGRGGLRFRAGDATDLARVLRRLLDEPDLAPALAATAPAVKSIEECAAEMEVKYRQAIGLAPEPPQS